MACRIGITTDLIARRAHWKRKYPKSFRKWKKLGTYYSKSKAQVRETVLAKKYGCESHHGGGGPKRATWHVYRFDHSGT